MAKQKELADLFLDTLKDIYFAEKKILSALPKMAKAAQSPKLKAAFEKHHAETDGQVERLEKIFDLIEETPGRPVTPSWGFSTREKRSWKNTRECPPSMRVC